MNIKTKFTISILLVLVLGFGITLLVNQMNLSNTMKKQIHEKMGLTVYKYIQDFNRYTDSQLATARTLGKIGGIVGESLRDKKGMSPEGAINLLLSTLGFQPLAGGGLFYDKGVIPGYEFFGPYASYSDGKFQLDETYIGLPEKQTTLYKRSKYRDNLNKKCTEERGKALKSVHFTMG
uniref:Uncharacterized protein n=1 Tax=Gracilinema caldarium (strain ATCC 51460 / DSM 7334 / H1) TaxID=744872 RepID=F8EXW0_GRAC1|nr:hypothetical protein [Gracilinema caldarium]AEJ20124.1 hypothetical protein Spica_1996 [Gracilinema caldarium DSM 7334]